MSTPATLTEPLVTSPLPTDSRRASVLTAVMCCEWRLVRFDLSWWCALGMLLVCVSYSLWNGQTRCSERAAAVLAAQKDEAERLTKLTKQLERITSGEAKAPDAPYRDPRNAIYVGRGSAATVAHLPDTPLSATAIGVSDLFPHVFKVNAGSQDGFLFLDELANPTHLLSGSFDLAFVFVALFPLLLLALSYDVLSAEQEQGTLALTVASSAPLITVLVGKLMVRAGTFVLVALGTTWAGLWCRGAAVVSSDGLIAFAMLSVAVVIYSLFWLSLALWINSLRRDSAFNAVALVLTWVTLLLIAPALMNAAAQTLYPAPARAEMVLAVREAAIDTERDREATDARYRESHPESTAQNPTAPKRDDRTQRTLAVTVAADARADTVLARHEAQVQAQRRLNERLAYLAPPSLMNDALAELAGQGHSRWDDYLARVSQFHATWQEFFVDRAQRDAPLTLADYQHFPRFDATPPTHWFADSLRRITPPLAWVFLLTTALWMASSRRLVRPC